LLTVLNAEVTTQSNGVWATLKAEFTSVKWRLQITIIGDRSLKWSW